ncbi:glycerol kinase GlpK [Candidatus Pelagibacter sp. HIMB1321]|uniref:glycerol kinase GlpK n=1 Tax=Candidatus Pelagibacter sp. HIMB1321 TaxID=1388755 RepID=UPI000A07DFF6|nr:glycerol kinase GlpK [Candidatus Pelagibacter sp. HIMB1321]SMF78182.1 glycerol kinase [Candidatus Pelagibacter sp. HIMB1321]
MPKHKFIISIDQGTTSSRAILFDLKGRPKFVSQMEFKQYFPKDGWVEHDPEEIWSSTKKVLKDVIAKSKKLNGKVLTIGITNQRETTILWDKHTGKAVYNAIVWQDRRSSEYCKKLIKQKKETIIYNKTGLLIDAYFSATKIKWIIDNVPKARELIKKKRLLFGTVDSFLLWRLTNGADHATDATNASRTMLFNISTNEWDDQILKILKIPREILPIVKDCSADFGHTDPSLTGVSYPITGIVGDQQSASIGQCCFETGSLKSTYGTGAFVLLNTGRKKVYSKNRLLTTIGYRIKGQTTYALEGSIFIAGAGVQWLRDKIKFIKKASDTEKIIKSLKSNNGIYLVPAFTGLGAPYWAVNARGILSGLTRDTGPKEIVRATVESVAYQTHDLFEAMKNDGLKPKIIKVDGGMVKNNWFSQFLSDVVDIKVLRPKVDETTALGAAFMAGLQIGVYKSLEDISNNWQVDRSFIPKMKSNERKKLINGWDKAIRKTLS